MIELQLCTINKVTNSDEQPKEYKYGMQASLKEDTSVINPIFIIDLNKLNEQTKGALNEKLDINYAYSPDLGRYYWVDDIVIVTASVIHIHCHTDVLATYRTWIDKHELFIKYASDKKAWNKIIDDDRLSPEIITTGLQTSLFSADLMKSLFDISSSYSGLLEGTYILVADVWDDGSGSYAGMSSCATWAIKRSELDKIYAVISTWLNSMSGSFFDNANLLLKRSGGLGSPINYVKSLRWVPWGYDNFTESEDDVCIASYKTSAKGKLISNAGVFIKQCNGSNIKKVKVAYDPEIVSHYPFLKREKYTSITIHHPSGILDIPADPLITDGDSEIVYSLICGKSTGDYALNLYSRVNGAFLGCVSGNLSIDWTYTLADGAGGAAAMQGMNNVVSSAAKFAMTTLPALSIASNMSSRQDVMVPAITAKNPMADGRGSVNKWNKQVQAQEDARAHNAMAARLRTADLGAAVSSISISDSPIMAHHGGGSMPPGVTGLAACLERYAGDVIAHDNSNIFSIQTTTAVPHIMEDATASTESQQYAKYCEKFGYPVYAYMKLSDLDAGFVKAEGPLGDAEFTDSTRCHPTTEELARIVSYVNSGYYRTTAKS